MKCKLCPNKVEDHKIQETELCRACWEKPFPITCICRKDLEASFSPVEIDEFEDADMVTLADRMTDLYTEQSFWLHMELIGKSILEDK